VIDRPLNVAVFASGRGSNFQSILAAVERGELDISVVLCLSDRESAGALVHATKQSIPTSVIHPRDYQTADEYADALGRVLERHGVDFIVLAGYLKKIPTEIIRMFRHRIINIHPALLPAFGGVGMYGRRVHEAVIEYGVHWTGATVHVVDEEYDTGPIVLQEAVPVFPDDSPEDVADRVLEVEHRLYPAALRLFAQNRIHIEGRRVRILDMQGDEPVRDDADPGCAKHD
jgi:phosphoribosylglycinamide formyltransferase-1